ncbi:MAG: hypothetical protein AAF430_08285 [Myxococcota bacterium]
MFRDRRPLIIAILVLALSAVLGALRFSRTESPPPVETSAPAPVDVPAP